MDQESIDETIDRLRRDRQAIKDRMLERNQLYEKATQNYLSSLQREVETIKKTQPLAETRNQEFREQMANLFLRYEAGSVRLKQAIQRTNIEKINYNDYLIKVYPNYFTEEKKKLKEENQRLMMELQGYKAFNNQMPLQELNVIENADYNPAEQQKLQEYFGQGLYDQEQQPQIPNQSYEYQNKKQYVSKQDELNLLEEYYMKKN